MRKDQETITVKNVDKILEDLDNENYTTPSELCKNLNMNNIAITIGLKFLDRIGKIEIITNGKTKLVRLKNGTRD